MGQIRVPEPTSLPWMAPRNWTTTRDGIDLDLDDVVTVTETDGVTAARMHHPGGPSELQLLEVRVPPDMEIEVHAHASDEIIYVLEGELQFGARTLGPGGSVYIPAWTLYGFRAGSAQLRFLNFRATADVSYITKEQFLAERPARPERA